MASENILITGATGKLGQLVIEELQKRAPQAHVIGLVRNLDKAQPLAARGVELREANYDDPPSLARALAGVDKVLLISGNEVGKRIAQHRNVIEAARAAGVKLLGYTSILRADTNPMGLAVEHRGTEELIRASGVPFVFLRNGWYTENYLGSVGLALQHGALIGAAGTGRIASAARADYAAAAAVVFARPAAGEAGKIHELAGDESYTLAGLAAEIARQSGKPVVYSNLSEQEYKAALVGLGLPEFVAAMLAESDSKAAGGSLYDDSHGISRLTGHPTTTLAQSVAAALAA